MVVGSNNRLQASWAGAVRGRRREWWRLQRADNPFELRGTVATSFEPWYCQCTLSCTKLTTSDTTSLNNKEISINHLVMSNTTRPIVFMDINIGETPAGRMKMELFSDIVPK